MVHRAELSRLLLHLKDIFSYWRKGEEERPTVFRAENFASNKLFSIHCYLFAFPQNGKEDFIHTKGDCARVTRAENSELLDYFLSHIINKFELINNFLKHYK